METSRLNNITMSIGIHNNQYPTIMCAVWSRFPFGGYALGKY